jgi:hypothetical protein
VSVRRPTRARLIGDRDRDLDARLFRLGYRQPLQHYAGCAIGNGPGAKCSCDEIARKARAAGRFLH